MTTRGAAGHWHMPLPLRHLASLACFTVTLSAQLRHLFTAVSLRSRPGPRPGINL